MRKRFKIPLIAIVTVVVLIVSLAVWAVWSGWVQARLVRFANAQIPEQVDLEVHVGEIETDLFNRFAADNVLVSSRLTGDTIATFERIGTRYHWRDLWRGDWTLNNLEIQSPRFFLPRDSVIEFVRSFIPVKTAISETPARLFRVIVDTLQLSNATAVDRNTHAIALDSLSVLARVSIDTDTISIRVSAGECHEPRLGHIEFDGSFVSSEIGWRADSVTVHTDRSHVFGHLTEDRWVVEANPIDFEDIRIIVKQLPPARLQFSGEVTPPNAGGWHFEGRATGNLADFAMENLDVAMGIDGRILTFERVQGYVSGAYWRGRGTLDAGQRPVRYGYDGTVRNLDLQQWVDNGLASKLSGYLSARGMGFADPSFDLDLDVDLTAGEFDGVEFDEAVGQMTVSLDEVKFDNDFVLSWDNNVFEGGGRVGYRDSLDIFGNLYSDDVRAWRTIIGLDSLGGRSSGYIYISGQTTDPDLAGRLLSDSLYLSGVFTQNLSASIFVPQFMTRREGIITAHLGQTRVGGLAVDSAIVRATLGQASIRFDSIMTITPALTMQGRGRFDWSTPQMPLEFYPLELSWEDQRFSAGDTVALLIDSAGIYLDLLSVNSTFGYFEAAGRYDFNDSVEFILGIEGFPVAPVWQRFMPGTEVDGEFDCTALLRGTMSDPIVELDGQFSSLRYGRLRLGTFEGEVTYNSRRLRTDRLVLNRQRLEAIFSGVLPLDFSIDPPHFEFLNEPLQGYLTASGEAIPAAYFLPETVEYLRGPFSVSAEVSGTLKSPLFNGTMFLRSGELKATEITSPITGLSADIRLQQDTIRIERATGVIRDKKKTGQISAKGSVRLLTYKTFDYNVAVTGRSVPARFEFEDYYVETDLDLEVVGVTPPLVRGVISPIRVEDRVPFDDDPIAEIADTNSWDWDLEITMPGNYWIHNDQIDAELSADMRLLRERGEITYLGTAEFIRGQVYLFDKSGRIRRGTLGFNNVGEPDPLLDIDLRFRIRQPRPDAELSSAGSIENELELHVGGTANEPIIDLLDPDQNYSEQDVLLLLTANTAFGASGNDITSDPLGDRLRFAATGLLLSEVQRVAARKLGLQTLEIISGGATDNTEVTVGRYFTPSLYLYGSSPIDVGGGQEVGFEYRFNRNMYLEGSRDRANLYRLNIHFNWDY